MNSLMIFNIIGLAQGVLRYLALRQADLPASPLEVLTSIDLPTSGLDEDIIAKIRYARLGLAFLAERDIMADDIINRIVTAESEGRDITREEIAEYIIDTGSEIDDTQTLIDLMPDD